MRQLRKLACLVLVGGWLVSAGAWAQEKKDAPPLKDQPPFPNVLVPPPSNVLVPPPSACMGVVFVVNEVGENERLSLNLKQVMCDNRAPFAMETVHWSSFEGRCRDHKDPDRRVQAASCLANKVLHIRKGNPCARVIFVAHGDGTHIALMAGEMLPPKSVDRMILLAPAVSCCYDLRMALRSTRDGIDNFFGMEDARLERLQERLRTADIKKDTAPAGLAGFCLPAPKFFPGIELYQTLLRQHKWDPDCEDFGVVGWHNSWIRERFLRCYILPLFSITEPICVLPPHLIPPPKK